VSFTVYDIQDTKADRLAVALDLEAAAASYEWMISYLGWYRQPESIFAPF
jgi:hypothetical protein